MYCIGPAFLGPVGQPLPVPAAAAPPLLQAAPPAGAARSSSSTPKPQLRTEFPETWIWVDRATR